MPSSLLLDLQTALVALSLTTPRILVCLRMLPGFAMRNLSPLTRTAIAMAVSAPAVVATFLYVRETPLDVMYATVLIFKEAINNAAKYSEAKSVKITFSNAQGDLKLNIHDNGKGFDAQNGSPGNGLKNMNARAKNIQGKLELKSSIGFGTEINLSLPIT